MSKSNGDIRVLPRVDRGTLHVVAGPVDKCLRYTHPVFKAGFVVGGIRADWCSDANFPSLEATYHRLAEKESEMFLNAINFAR